MREKDLPIDRSKHVLYTKKAKQCVQKLLRRAYDEKTAAALWEKIQMQYATFLEEEPALGGVKMTVSIYDPILIFAWYVTVPDKPPIEDVQQEVFDCFMSAFETLGRVFDLNRKAEILSAVWIQSHDSSGNEPPFEYPLKPLFNNRYKHRKRSEPLTFISCPELFCCLYE